MPTLFDFAWLIPLFPLLAFVAISLFAHPNRTLSEQLAIYLGAVISFVLAFLVLLSAVVVSGELPIEIPLLDRWFSLGLNREPIGISIDPVGAALLLTLALIYLIISIYSKEALRDDARFSRFFALLSLLAAGAFAMLVFDNLLVLLIAWEIMDVCIYLLTGLGHEGREEEGGSNGSLKTFLIAQVGNLCLLLGLALLYAQGSSLAYGEAFGAANMEALRQSTLSGDFPTGGVIAWLFLGAVIARCAQVPLHTWLPEANEAPAGAGALIHATAIASGAFLLMRALPVFDATAASLSIPSLGLSGITLVGTLTAVLTSLAALAQRDIRHAVSLSAASQAGTAIAALGIGAQVAALFHILTTLSSITLLLLAAEWVARGMARGRQEAPSDEPFDAHDMAAMGGLYDRLPAAFWTFFIGGLALSGLPPLLVSGFWSKDALLAQVWASNPTLFWILACSGGLTTFGAMRQVSLVFVGAPRSQAASRAAAHIPTLATLLILLCILVMGLGWIGIPAHFPALEGLPNLLESFLGAQDTARDFLWDSRMLGLAFSTLGLIAAFVFYAWAPLRAGEPDRLEQAMRRMWLGWLYQLMRNRFYADALVGSILARGAVLLAGGLAAIENGLNLLTDGLAFLAQRVCTGGQWLDVHVLSELTHLAGRAGERLSHAGNLFEQHLLGQLSGLAHGGTLALARLGDLFERAVLAPAVDGAGRLVRVAGLGFRPRTGRVQNYLLLACAAVAVLAAVFLFLFLQV